MSDAGHAVAQLRELSGELEAHLHRREITDQLAYTQLTVDGERQPWTLAAQRTWGKGGGTWRDHHLAIAYHARAYDLEQQGEVEEAHECWLEALRCWARLVDSDAFWERMCAHLAEAMGADPPGELVASVRAGLPRDLLEPNLARAMELRASHPDLARLHMTAVRESGLPAAAVAEVRREFAEQITEVALRDVQAGRYDAGIDAVEASLTADPTNPRLVEGLLYAVRQTLAAVAGEEGWAQRLHGFLDRIERLVRPYTQQTGLDERAGVNPEIIRELARFEFYRGVQRRALMMDTQDNPSVAVGHAVAAIPHLEKALGLDAHLTDDGPYREARVLLTQQYIYAAYFTQLVHRGDLAVRRFLGPALRALGTRPNAEGQPELAPQVVAHLASPSRGEVRQAQLMVTHLLNHPDTPPQKRGELSNTRSLLTLREGTLQ